MIVDCAVYEQWPAPGGRDVGRRGVASLPPRRRVRLARPVRAEPRRSSSSVSVGVRPAPAGGRGRDQRSPAPEARGVRRDAAPGAEAGALHRPRRGGRDRRDRAVRQPGVPDLRAPRQPEPAEGGARAPGTRARAGRARARARSCTRSWTGSWTTTSRWSRASRSTSRRSRSRCSRRTATTRRSGSTTSSARCSTSAGRSQPLAPAVERLATRPFEVDRPELQPYFRDVHDHLLRVSAPGGAVPGPAVHRAGREPDPDQRAPERGHAADHGMGGDRRRADRGRRRSTA